MYPPNAPEEPTKYCPRCEKDKPIDEFGINRARSDGRKSYCNPCQAAYTASRPKKPKPPKVKLPPEPPPETLVCTKCGWEGPLVEFPLEPRARWGRRKQCQKCRTKAQAAAVAKRGPRPVSVEKKKCARCGKTKVAKAFSPDNRQPDGLQSTCLECYADEDKERRVTDPEYRERKNTSSATSQAKYDVKYKAKRKETRENRTPEQIEADHAYDQAYYAAHKEELNAANRTWYRDNAEAARVAGQIRSAARYVANPKAFVDKIHLRKARMNGLPYEKVDFGAVAERDGCLCQLCGLWVDLSFKHPHRLHGTRHHVQAVTLDGGWVMSNVVLVHRFCNLSVGNRPVTPEVVAYLQAAIMKEYEKVAALNEQGLDPYQHRRGRA